MWFRKELSRDYYPWYLDVWIDKNLSWSAHTRKLPFIWLAVVLYYVVLFVWIVYSYHDIIALCTVELPLILVKIKIWGTANQKRLREVEIKMNNSVHTIIWIKNFTQVAQLHKKLNFENRIHLFKLSSLEKGCLRFERFHLALFKNRR